MSSQPSSPHVLNILHLGLGSFHRAHMALYLHQLQQAGDHRWRLAAGNIRDDQPELIAALQAQNGAYTLETVSPQGERSYTRITSLSEVIAYDKDLSGLIRVGSDPNTRIISFTVTEAGYYLDANVRLDTQFEDLKNDILACKNGQTPCTIYGALRAILLARKNAGAGPVTLLNCDNLRHNGDKSRAGLLQFLDLCSEAELKKWVEDHTSSPNCMVDRITPRPTLAVRERVLAATGIDDATALMGESFIQWVVEEDFIAERPKWERVGVEMVDSVQAYEEAKIRLLNATHSCIAWAGSLVGYHYIHEGTLDTSIRQMAYDYITNDAIPVLDTLENPCPINLFHYRDVVLDRFSNPAIADTNQRVAMDGFSKIPGFIAPTIRERLAAHQSIQSVSLLPALFLAYLQRWHLGLIPYVYQDQAMDTAVAHAICEAPHPVKAFCADTTLWDDLAGDPRLIEAISKAYDHVLLFIKNRS